MYVICSDKRDDDYDGEDDDKEDEPKIAPLTCDKNLLVPYTQCSARYTFDRFIVTCAWKDIRLFTSTINCALLFVVAWMPLVFVFFVVFNTFLYYL